MAKLVISRKGTMLGSRFLETARLVVGRASGCDVQLDDPSVSKQHALIEIVGNDHILQDLGSANGTFVNGARATRHLLRHGDVIEVRDFQIRYIDHKSVVGGEGDRTMVIPRSQIPPGTLGLTSSATATPAARAVNVAFAEGVLRGIAGKLVGKEIALDRVLVALGDTGKDRAAIFRRLGGFYITRIDGQPPRVNGKPISAGWQPLAQKDFIEIGGDTLQLWTGSAPAA